MRIHALDIPDYVRRATRVRLDGRLIENCVEADDQEGWADVYTGRVVTSDRGLKAEVRRLTGRVEFVID